MIWLALPRALALDEVTVELGASLNESAATDAYKLDVCSFDQPTTLLGFGADVVAEGDETVRVVAYEWVGGDLWELRHDAGAWALDAGDGLQSVADLAWDFEAGSVWAVGLYLDVGFVGYNYGDVGLQSFSWGSCGGIVFSGSGDTPALPDLIEQVPSENTYRYDLTLLVQVDADLDGYGELDDCDDADPAVHPDADERCNGRDDDCNEIVDDEIVDVTYYLDADEDGYADEAGPSLVTCSDPDPGYTVVVGDCDDTDAAAFPGAEEICDGSDDDCDSVVDEGIFEYWFWPDADGDGFGDGTFLPEATCESERAGMVWNDKDCDDAAPEVNPLGVETCDQRDEDCDNLVDEDFPLTNYWPDADGDGFGDLHAVTELRCDVPTGFVAESSDCDDDDADRFPGATEQCNGLDDDCSGTIEPDENADGDGDGALDCADCDAADPTVFPGAPEACDGTDHDCDGAARTDCAEPPATTDPPVGGDKEGDDASEEATCGGCATGSSGPGLGWLLLPLLGARRRR